MIKEPLTDEQLQKELREEAKQSAKNFYGEPPQNSLSQNVYDEELGEYDMLANSYRIGYIAAATSLQALLKEKDETIVCIERNYQQLLNAYEEMKACTDKAIKEKEAEIERLNEKDSSLTNEVLESYVTITRLNQELTNLRALHTQQMEECWDEAVQATIEKLQELSL